MALDTRPSVFELPQQAITDLREWWRQRDADQSWLAWLGIVLLASGLFHVLVWLVDGGSLLGPVSWRKPIVFGLSGGVTTLSLAWVVGLLPAGRGRRWWTWIYVVALALEVVLITMQQWRGVASHFNGDTALDAAVFSAMGLLIMVVSVAIVRWTWGTRRAAMVADTRRAAMWGLVLLDVSLVLGVFLAVHGSAALEADPTAQPAIVGAAGAPKVPHALALHAIQLLPVFAWLLRRYEPSEARRVRLLDIAGTGYALVVLAAIVQMAAGRAPTEIFVPALVLAGTGVVALGAAFVGAFLLPEGPASVRRRGEVL